MRRARLLVSGLILVILGLLDADVAFYATNSREWAIVHRDVCARRFERRDSIPEYPHWFVHLLFSYNLILSAKLTRM